MAKKGKALGVFSLAMITAGSVDSIRNLPATALFGTHLVFFFLLGAVFFLLPTALVAAELASTSRREGGIFAWVTDALGLKTGFLAIWFQWIENVIWYPAILSTLAATIGYLFSPTLATSPYFLISVILVCFWGVTLINIAGMRASAWVANICSVFGLLLPMALIIGLALYWVLSGHPSDVHITWHNWAPHDWSHVGIWVALTGIMLSFCGMEIATVHSRETANPQRDYPRAMLLATAIILVTLVSGSLAIAVVLPTAKISLVAGIMQAFDAFFSAYHLHYILPAVAVMLVLGLIGSVNNWTIAPTRGLAYAMKEIQSAGHFEKLNKHGAPAKLLLVQAVVVSIISMLYLMLPSVNAVYWLFTALASQIYMVMYILMFISAVVLRKRNVERKAGFMIPGGMLGLSVVAAFGLIGSAFTFFIGFFPPSDMGIVSPLRYEILIVLGLTLMVVLPWVWVARKRLLGSS
jgi:glutamate:GABA antiporter